MSYDPFKHIKEDLDNNSIIKQTQLLRFKAINALLEENAGMPKDPKDREFLTKLLDSADRVAINLKRIDSNEKQNDKDREAALLTSKILSRVQGNPFAIDADLSGINLDTLEDDALNDYDPVPGEMEVGVQDIDYDTLMGIEAE